MLFLRHPARRRVMLGVAVLATTAGVLTTGCEPRQLGAAAIVGDHRITLSDIQHRVDVALRDDADRAAITQAGQLGELTRQIVSYRVMHVLLDAAAERDGIVVTPDEVTREITDRGGAEAVSRGMIYDAGGAREAIRDRLIAQRLARRNASLTVVADLAVVQSRQQAVALARAVATDPARSVTVMTAAAPQTTQANRAIRLDDPSGIGTTAIFGAKPGTVLAFAPLPDSAAETGWFVVYVRARTPADPAATTTADPDLLQALGQRQVQPLAEEVGVKLNPRYGVWDSGELRAVKQSEVSGVSYLARQRSAAP